MFHARAARFVNISVRAAALLVFAAGCKTTIPETDTSAPRVELRISGPSVGHKKMSNPPFSVWEGGYGRREYIELVAGEEYKFELRVSDDGGVARAFIEMPLQIEVYGISPGNTVTVTDAFMREMTVTGTRSDPTSQLFIAGRMRPLAPTVVGFAFHAEGDNYGGRLGPLCRTFLSTEASIVPAAP